LFNMTRLRVHGRLNEASEIITDPLNLAMLVRSVEIVESEHESSISDAINVLLETSRRLFSEQGRLAYSAIRYDRRRKSFRLLMAGDLILGILGETPDSLIKGSEAYSLLMEVLSKPSSPCSFVIGELSPEHLPPELKSILEEALKAKIVFPDAWIGRSIYGFKVVEALYSGEDYYKLRATGADGQQYVILIPNQEKPDAMNKLLVNAVDALSYQLTSMHSRNLLSSRGVNPETIDRLSYFSKYMSPCIGLIISQGVVDEQKYLEQPPCIVELYEEGVSLSVKLREASLSPDDALLILHRLTGLSVNVNLLGYGFNALSPENIRLVNDPSEPSGFKPIVEGCVNLQRLDSPYRGLLVGLETLDPVALVTGTLTPLSNIFMASMTTIIMLLGKSISVYTQLNKLASNIVLGAKTPLLQEPELAGFTEEARFILEQLVKGEVKHQEALAGLDELVSRYSSTYISELKNRVGEKTLGYLVKTLSINPEKRLANPLDAFKTLETSLLEDGYSRIIAVEK